MRDARGGVVRPTIDPSRTWGPVAARLATEADPVVRHRLETVLEHMRAEAEGDLERLMATVGHAAHYHAYGGPPGHSPAGWDAVRRFYEDVVASGIHRLELAIDRLVADRSCVVTEGILRMAWPGATLGALGIEVGDTTADYLYEARMAIFWTFDDDGLVAAEDSYAAGDGLAGIADRPLLPGQVRHA